MTEQDGKKAIVAMSGGVDSSVAALIARNSGIDCMGVTLKLFRDNEDENEYSVNRKPFAEGEYSVDMKPFAEGEYSVNRKPFAENEHSVDNKPFDEANEAKRVSDSIGIPHRFFDFSATFKEKVIEPFIDGYSNGLTPNPCINCNFHIKLGLLLSRAEALGFDFVVTGHYSRITYDDSKKRYLLLRAKDRLKDQSYMLYTMNQHQLAHALFPLGDFTKAQVREIATENGFCNANKQDSQDICFIPEGDYAGFIEQFTERVYPEGDFVDLDGNVIGRHKGLVRYTVGQRKGLGLAFGTPRYVIGKHKKSNTVILGTEDKLFSKEVQACSVNLISVDHIIKPMRVTAKTRYTQVDKPATVIQTDADRIMLEFDEPQRAAAPGQALVMYSGDVVVGGGTICEFRG